MPLRQADIDSRDARYPVPNRAILAALRAGIASSLYRTPIGQRLRLEASRKEDQTRWARKVEA